MRQIDWKEFKNQTKFRLTQSNDFYELDESISSAISQLKRGIEISSSTVICKDESFKQLVNDSNSQQVLF